MIFGSVCSGIEAASVAWNPLGWRAAWFAEIEPFCCSLLGHRYPEVPNLGDITAEDFCERARRPGTVDVVVGGTPCQSFSVAGLRKGLADPRGQLLFGFLRIVDALRPRWVLWENVPGVLSSNDGRDFGAFLGAMGELGYGVAYRVLDAQYVGLAQRRKRVFVVGHLGDWRRAAAVLFERHSLSWNPAPSREAGARVAGSIKGRSGNNGSPERSDLDLVAHSLRADGFDASEDGTGRGTPLVPVAIAENQRGELREMEIMPSLNIGGGKPGRGYPAIAFSCKDHGADAGNIAPTLRAMPHDGSHANAGGQVAVAFHERKREGGRQPEAQEELAFCLQGETHAGGGGRHQSIANGMAVRRLTPMECERLQGFPDGYTLIQHRGKPAADGPRYKALGNSMAVPVIRWIGERIMLSESIR